MLTVNAPQLRARLDDGQEPDSVARDIGEGVRNDRGPTEPGKFIENDQHRQGCVFVGQFAHVEVDELLEQEIVERRDPVEFIRRRAEIDRHGALAELAKRSEERSEGKEGVSTVRYR